MSQVKTGDLVEVVKPTLCCGSRKSIGMQFRVMCVGTYDRLGECLTCGELLPKSAEVATLWGGPTCETERLKVIEEASDAVLEIQQGWLA